jgi:hypothetical protein
MQGRVAVYFVPARIVFTVRRMLAIANTTI